MSAPVLITQHMPMTFTTILAEHLSRAGAKHVREARDGEPVLAGTVYLAPGGQHMKVARRDGTAVIVLDDGAPVHFCKPAVDPLFASAAEVWGAWNLALILTGMGTDGTDGAAAIVAAGGSVIAQDEASSVVWGMPGSAVEAGVCSAVLPLDQIGPKVVRLFLGARTMTPLDYEYLRKLLKARSGLVLSAEKHYLVESRLLPIARKNGLFNLTGLVAKLKGTGRRGAHRRSGRGDDDERVAVLPRQDAVRPFPRHHHAGAARRAHVEPAHPHLVRGRRRPGRSRTRWRSA